MSAERQETDRHRLARDLVIVSSERLSLEDQAARCTLLPIVRSRLDYLIKLEAGLRALYDQAIERGQ